MGPFFNCYKLDASESAATPGGFTAFAGTEANLTYTAITTFGIGTLHNAKAQGNVANLRLDRMTYHANASYGLRINGGTSGVPETMADVQGDDVTNGWGMVSNPLGAQYAFIAPTEWGEPAANADVYFTAAGDNAGGRAVGATHFPMRIVGNATDTIDVKWTNLVVVNTGTRAEFVAGDTNVNVMQFSNVTFTDIGTIDYTTQSAGNRFANNCTYNNCGQVYFNTMDMDGATFNGSLDANGALLWDDNSNPSNQDNVVLNSDGTGHGIQISLNTAALTTFNISGYEVTGYGGGQDTATGNELFFIDNALDGDVTINVTGGSGTFNNYRRAAGYTGTVTIVQTVTLTLTGIETDSEVRILNLDDTTNFNKELAGTEQILGEVQSADIVSGGTGYTVNDTLTVVGGTGTAATLTVDAVSGGVITAVSVAGAGSYSANPTNPVSVTGGTGSNATFSLDISGEFSYSYDAGLGAEVAIVVFHIDFVETRIIQTLPSVSSTVPIQQRGDRVYNNP